MSTYRRDLLQVDDQQALKADEIRHRVVEQDERRRDRLASLPRDRDVEVQMIDDRRVERLLLFEQRRDDAPDGSCEPPAQSATRRCRLIDLPQRVERRDLAFVGQRRGCGNSAGSCWMARSRRVRASL